jgi:hypothetical protein
MTSYDVASNIWPALHNGDAVLRSAWLSGTTAPPVLDLPADDPDGDLGGTGDSSSSNGGGAGAGRGARRGVVPGMVPGMDVLRSFLVESARPVELLVRAYLARAYTRPLFGST